MTKDITYRCDFCREILGIGYGINWTGKGGGDTINLVADTYNAKQLEHHLCLRCVSQIANEYKKIENSGAIGVSVKFSEPPKKA